MNRSILHRASAVPFVVAVFLASPRALSAGEEMLLVHDAYVSTKKVTKNFGAKPTLLLSGTDLAFLQFDLSPLPAGIAAAAIQKANLWLWVSDVKAAGSFAVRRVIQPWTEETISALLAPQTIAGAEPAAVPVAIDAKAGYVVVDVTALVKDWVASTVANHGIALVANPGASLVLDSKENTNSGKAPRLDVLVATGPQGGSGITGYQYNAGDFPMLVYDVPHFVSNTVTLTVAAGDKLSVDAMGSFTTGVAAGEHIGVRIGYRKAGTSAITLAGLFVGVAVTDDELHHESASLSVLIANLEPGTYEVGLSAFPFNDAGHVVSTYSTGYSVRVLRFP